MIRGITVLLYQKTETGIDAFGTPIYEEVAEAVENVLVAPATTTDITDSTNLYGKKAIYNLGIPKGDQHDWENKRVDFFGRSWRAFGFVLSGIDANVPTQWNGKVMVEAYE